MNAYLQAPIYLNEELGGNPTVALHIKTKR